MVIRNRAEAWSNELHRGRVRGLFSLLGLLLLLGSCMAPAPAVERATDKARELNLAARFGRMDIAASLAEPSERRAFMERRASWGNELRIVDVELAGVDTADHERMTVYVDVAWVRQDESLLRSTRLAQTWSESNRGWQLTDEAHAAGDSGLFGEDTDEVHAPRPDVHFPVKTLR